MSSAFEIIVDLDVLDQNTKWLPGVRLGVNDDKEFIKFLVDEFVIQFRQAIQKQSFGRRPMKDTFVPLSKPWEARKERMELLPGFWQATGQIANNLRGVRIGDSRRYRIGWDKRKVHRKALHGGKLGGSAGIKTWKLVRILEFGPIRTNDGRLQRGRPLIRPIMWTMKRDIRNIYLAFLKTRLEFDRRGQPLPRRGTAGRFITDDPIDKARRSAFRRLFGANFRAKDRF